MDRQTFVTLATVLQPVFEAIGVYLMARIAIATTRYVHSRTVGALLVALERYAAASVAFVYQAMVKELKDETKPGVWTAEMGQAAKAAAMARLKQMTPAVIAALRASGADTDATLSQFIEREVMLLNARLSAARAAGSRTATSA